MKQLIVTLAFILLATASWAAKAYPLPITVKQADGTQLTIIGHGDEDFNWVTTTDGVLLIQVGNAYYVAKTEADGTITATDQLAHNKESRQAKERQLIAQQDKQAFLSKGTKTAVRRKAMRVGEQPNYAKEISGPTYFPHKGSPKAIVILVEFQDVKFTVPDPVKSFNQYLNAEGALENYGNNENRNYGSVRQYFKDMSFGQFTPQFDVYGPVTMPQNSAYYGGSSAGGGGEKHVEMLRKACDLADDLIDFTQYAFEEGSKNVLVYVIYAGYGESTSQNASDLWPKSWGGSTFAQHDGMNVVRCGINNELYSSKSINGIGLFCHEFSHCLGLPDFYERGSKCDNNNELEYWDLMDGGEYSGWGGYCPTPYTPWEREALGWLKIDTLQGEQQVTLTPIQEEGKAYRILNDNDETGNEYYIVENIQQRGWYHAIAWNSEPFNSMNEKGHGLLVYHVDYDENWFRLNSLPNSVEGHPRMTIVAADGNLLSDYHAPGTEDATRYYNYFLDMHGDPFPGTAQVDSLTDDMLRKDNAQMLFTYKGKLNKPIYNIKEDENGVITFDFMKKFPTTGIAGIVAKDTENDNRIFTLDGRYVGTDPKALTRGIYIIGKRKISVQ